MLSMSVKLLTGPIGSGKTSYLLDILLSVRDPESALYIVPSDYTAGELRRHVLDVSKKPLLGDVFLSWNHFLSKLAEVSARATPLAHLSLFIYQLLKSHPLRYFRKESISIGIAREFATTIVTLKQNLIDPPTLRHELETRGSLKENDLLTVFERYEQERKKHGIIDDGDIALTAASNMRQGKLSSLGKARTILIDEFYTFPPGVRTLLHTLAMASEKINIIA